MGKNKSNQRTKGNVKPSSSSRSAELNGGHGGFIGFSGVTNVNYVPAASQMVDECEVDAEFRIILRKLDKKDPTTKLKGLQEFLSLCEKKEIDSVKSVLPFWPRLYTRLCLDNNDMVREDVQHAHHSLVNQTKKQFTPYLKGVMPTWLLAMVDPNTCVAARAKRAFEENFSIPKRPNVLMFSAEEILKYLSDNILVHSSEVFADKNSSQEENDNKYTRIVCSSLKALGLFLVMSDDSNSPNSAVEERLSNILQLEKFWSYSKHKNPIIKAAWFDCLTCLIENFKNMEEVCLPMLSKSIFSSINCSEAVCLPHVWKSLLMLTAKVPKCWEHCNNHEALCSKIFAVLRDGGREYAIELYPCLEPLLRLMPEDILNHNDFYTKFFKSISSSLRKDDKFAQREETKAIIFAMFQCISYLQKKDVLSPEQWQSIVTHQIMGHIKSSWDENPLLQESCLYRQIALILVEWSQHEEANNSKLSLFWELFLPECYNIIESNSTIKINSLIMMFDTFSGRKTKVRKFVEFSAFPKRRPDPIPSAFIQYVSTNVAKLLKVAYHSSVNQTKDCFGLFYCLITTFPSTEAFNAILDKPCHNVDLTFMNDIILPMLDRDSQFPIQDSVNIFLHLSKTLSTPDRVNVLFGLKPALLTESMTTIIKELWKCEKEDFAASSWLQSPEFGCRLVEEIKAVFVDVAATENEIVDNKDEAISLIRFIFSNQKQDQIISSERLNVIINVMRMTLKECEDGLGKWNVTCLVTSLMGFLMQYSLCWNLPETTELFSMLFYNLVTMCHPDSREYDLLLDFVKLSLVYYADQYIEHGSALFEHSFLSRFMDDITEIIHNDDFNWFRTVAEVAKVLFIFMDAVFAKCPKKDGDFMLDHTLVRDIFDWLIPTKDDWLVLESSLDLNYITSHVYSRRLIFDDFPLKPYCFAKENWKSNYPKECLFFSILLRSVATTSNKQNNLPVCLSGYTNLCVQILHGESYITEMISMSYKTKRDFITPDLEDGAKNLTFNVDNLMKLVNEGNKKHMIKLFRNRCTSGEYFFPISLMTALKKWLHVDVDTIKLLKETHLDSDNDTTLLQIFASHLTDEERADLLCERVLSLKNPDLKYLPTSSLIEIGSLCRSHLNEKSTAMIKDIFKLLRASTIYHEMENCDYSSNKGVHYLICLTELFSSLVKYSSKHFSHSDWDFTLCYLSSTVALVDVKSSPDVPTDCTYLLICSLSNLYVAVFDVMNSVSENEENYPSDLLEEWNQVYSQNVHKSFMYLVIDCSDLYSKHSDCYQLYVACESLSKCLCPGTLENLLHMSQDYLEKMSSSISTKQVTNLSDQDKFMLDKKLRLILDFSFPLLTSKHESLQLLSYSWLQKILPTIVQPYLDTNMDQIHFDTHSLPTACINIIEKAESDIEVYKNTLEDAEHTKVPLNVVYCKETCLKGYLLAFHLLFEFCKSLTERKQQLFVTYFGKKSHLHSLLCNLLYYLLPWTPSDGHIRAEIEEIFTEKFDGCNGESTNWFNRLVGRNFLHCLEVMPSDTRYWFMKLEKSTQQCVEKLTRVYVSPIIIGNEFKIINESNINTDMTVKTKDKMREVVATYVIDDTKLNLVLKISSLHPLTPATFTHSTVFADSVVKRGLNTMLVYRNATLLSALLFWKKNVDHKLVGVEECFICYSILQGTASKVPRLSCSTCKNRFHSNCMYKWFDTAGKTTCPICRSPFLG